MSTGIGVFGARAVILSLAATALISLVVLHTGKRFVPDAVITAEEDGVLVVTH
jgi:hypothetical protein